VHAYEAFCDDCVRRLNGMFAFALWSRRCSRLLLACDHTGKKQLFVIRSYYSVRHRLERFLEHAGASPEERYLGWVIYFNHVQLADLFLPEVAAQVDGEGAQANVERYLGEARALPLLYRLLHLNFASYLTGDLRVKMERMSMVHALETRSPMLDTVLMESVASLPPQPEDPPHPDEVRLEAGLSGSSLPSFAEP
jgi:asparagine synthetase B (glutamine-hydrolysing)